MNAARSALSLVIFPPEGCTFGKPPPSESTAQRRFYKKTIIATISFCVGCSDRTKVLKNSTSIRGRAPSGPYFENNHANSIALWSTLSNHSRAGYE